ncbi:hypothetical protein E2C01_031330 [Portunus trituberculatus]|uniref:Uncharacterized protein n=1 Tax=Portunus trituberculatus TaxID=210409 RepID=A0A5B7EXB6_PORTR|nr:hypothetical protein [Portunus trituberculatus]
MDARHHAVFKETVDPTVDHCHLRRMSKEIVIQNRAEIDQMKMHRHLSYRDDEMESHHAHVFPFRSVQPLKSRRAARGRPKGGIAKCSSP